LQSVHLFFVAPRRYSRFMMKDRSARRSGKGEGTMEISLDNGAVMAIDGGRGQLEFTCAGGRLWITRGDGRDYILTPGETLKAGRGEQLVVEAWGESRLLLERGSRQQGKDPSPAWHLAPTH
jgi:quercetin dioxygenase-like cupin family protein